MDVVYKIRAVKTGSAPAVSLYKGQEIKQDFQDVPKTPVVVESVRRETK